MSIIPILKNHYLERIRDHAKRVIDIPSFNKSHGWYHVLRVYDLADNISTGYKLNKLVLDSAVYMHDLGYGTNGENHEEISANMANGFLKTLEKEGFPKEFRELIIHAIKAHRFNNKNNIKPETIEAKILYDADKLDATGVIGFCRAVSYDPRRKLYHLEDPFIEGGREVNEDEFVIDHVINKLIKVREKLYTKEAIEIAEQRTDFLELMLDELKREIIGEA